MLVCRKRWVIIRDDVEIFCWFKYGYTFKRLDSIGDTAINTYCSEKVARDSFLDDWDDAERLISAGRIKFVETTESLEMNWGCIYEPATDAIWNIKYILECSNGDYIGTAHCPACNVALARYSDWDALSVPAGLLKRCPHQCPNCGEILRSSGK